MIVVMNILAICAKQVTRWKHQTNIFLLWGDKNMWKLGAVILRL